MFSPTFSNETPQPASTVPGFGFTTLITSEYAGTSSEAAISLLQQLAREQELGTRRAQDRTLPRSSEASAPLQKVPPGPWRSLGGYFDYGPWAERDRFMELDRAIAAAQPQMYDGEADGEMF